MSWYEFLGGILFATGGPFVIWYFFVWKPDQRELKQVRKEIERLHSYQPEYQSINRYARWKKEKGELRPTDPEFWTGV